MTDTAPESSYEIQQRIAELQKQKLAHEEIERKRQEAEKARLKAIADAEREIINLQAQQAKARWDETKAAVRRMSNDLDPKLADLVNNIAAVLQGPARPNATI